MLYEIEQTTEGLLPSIQYDGCLFLCFAESSTIIFRGKQGVEKLNNLWRRAEAEGIIDENMVIKHTELAKLFELNVHYDNKHHSADEEIPSDVKLVFGKYVWKYGHFVILNKNKEITFDSLGHSYSVANGKLESMRWYYAD